MPRRVEVIGGSQHDAAVADQLGVFRLRPDAPWCEIPGGYSTLPFTSITAGSDRERRVPCT